MVQRNRNTLDQNKITVGHKNEFSFQNNYIIRKNLMSFLRLIITDMISGLLY